MRKPIMVGISAMSVVALGLVGIQAEADGPDKRCNNMSDACLIEVANTYMDAQAGGPGTKEGMRLAATAHRWENAINNATTGDEIRAGSPAGPSDIWSQRDRDRLWVDGNDVFSIWMVDIKDADTGVFHTTAHIFERIRVEGGKEVCSDGLSPCVTEVEAIFCLSPIGLEPALPDPSEPRPSALCLRSDF